MIDPFCKNGLQSSKWGLEFKDFFGCDAAFWCIVGSIFGLWPGCLVAGNTIKREYLPWRWAAGCAGRGVKSKGHVISCLCPSRGSVRLWVWGHGSADGCKEHTLYRWVWLHLRHNFFHFRATAAHYLPASLVRSVTDMVQAQQHARITWPLTSKLLISLCAQGRTLLIKPCHYREVGCRRRVKHADWPCINEPFSREGEDEAKMNSKEKEWENAGGPLNTSVKIDTVPDGKTRRRQRKGHNGRDNMEGDRKEKFHQW